MIQFKGETNMFQDWTHQTCPIIPTNLTDFANAGIAATIRAHTPPNEFSRMHKQCPAGGMLRFSDGRIAWDFPTKRNLHKGTQADISLMQDRLRWLCSDANTLKWHGITTILLPKIGTGFGGLDWQDVWDDIVDIVVQLADALDVWVYSEEMSERIRIKVPVRI